ncbi:MAG: hypothetical protein SPL80_09700 [Bacilli bacterium]|nr:hypothetical protein [Bacilli bacterium]
MSKGIRRIFFGLSFVLFACAHTPQNEFDPERFPFSDDPDLVYVLRNGDNFTKRGLSYSYAETTVEATLDGISSQLNHGESSLLFLHSDSCGSCKAAHDGLTHFFVSSGIKVNGVHFSDTNIAEKRATLDAILNAYPSLAPVVRYEDGTYRTPTMFLIRDESHASPISFLSNIGSTDELDSFFRGLMNMPLLFEFTSYEAYSSFAKSRECLAYYDEDPEAFHQFIYPFAIHSPVYTARIKAMELTEADRAAFAKEFGDKDLIVHKGNEVIKENAADATSLIESFYA